MRKNKRIGMFGLAALAMAGAFGTQQAVNQNAAQEVRATAQDKRSRKQEKQADKGYDPRMAWRHESVPPKLYGLLHGHGNGKHKVNFLRLKHNAKLKRRRKG